MAVDYIVIPSADRFKKDSAVHMAVRSQDQRLHAMDRLLEKMPPQGGDRFAPLAELFMTCNSWIKGHHEKQKGLEKGRYPAVLALMDAAAKELMILLDVPSLSLLTLKLTEEFGLKNRSEGNDRHFGATFWDEAARETKRLHIKGGQFYRYMFDTDPPRKGLQPVDSHDFANMMIARPGGADAMPGFAGFVMSLDREFYMARHWVGGAPGGGGVFHSAYFNGPVAMAGTMLIQRGTLKGIRGDSGHYRPGDPAMVHALRALRSRGVNLRGVKVYGYAHQDGDATPNARAFNKAGAMAGKMGSTGGGGTTYQMVPERTGGGQIEFYSGAVDAHDVAEFYAAT